MTRRVWFAQDCLFTADPKIAELGAEFGPAGPMAITHLLGAAKLQGEGGRVTISYKSLARAAFLRSGAQAREIVARATELDILEMVAIDKVGFEGAFPKWRKWQVTDPNAADRKARQRRAGQGRDIDRDIDATVTPLQQQPVQKTETTKPTPPTEAERVATMLATVPWPGGEVSLEKVGHVLSVFPGEDFMAGACLAANWRESPTFFTEHAHVALRAALDRNRQRKREGIEPTQAGKVYDLRTTCRECKKQLEPAERSSGWCDECFDKRADRATNGDDAA